MNIEDCKNCEYHLEHVADSVLCKYEQEIEHRVLSLGTVVACPLENSKKKKKVG